MLPGFNDRSVNKSVLSYFDKYDIMLIDMIGSIPTAVHLWAEKSKIEKIVEFIETEKVVKFIQFTVFCLVKLKDGPIYRRIHKLTWHGTSECWGGNALSYIRRLYRLMSTGKPWKNETIDVTKTVIEDSVFFWMWSMVIIIEEQIDMIVPNDCNATQLKKEYAGFVDSAFTSTQSEVAMESARKELLKILHWKSTNHILYVKSILTRMRFYSIRCLVSTESLKLLGELQWQ